MDAVGRGHRSRMGTHTRLCLRTQSKFCFGVPERLAPRHISGVEPPSLDQPSTGRGGRNYLRPCCGTVCWHFVVPRLSTRPAWKGNSLSHPQLMSQFLLRNFEQRPLYLSLLATARTSTTLTLAATMIAIRAPVAGLVAQCKLPACIYKFHAITTRLFRTRAGAQSVVVSDSTACLVASLLAVMTRGAATSMF